jgi:hypothetical protein
MSNLKFGRRSPSRTPSIKFKSILKAMPDHPVSEDYLSQLSNWQMLGNDQYGDCVAVTWSNMRRFYSALLGENENYPNMDEVISIYKTQNPNFPTDDNGMDIQTLLGYLIKNGGPDGVKPIAFASVDYTNLEEVKAALAIFGGIWLGVNVQNSNMDDFNNGKPWDYHDGDSIEGGHSILAGGYLGKSSDDVRFITWAEETGFTDNFWKHLAEECWAVIWPESLGTKQFIQGIDLNQLALDYKSLTGRDLPLPQPTPIPTPQPTPTPQPIPTPTPKPTPVPPTPKPTPVPVPKKPWYERFWDWLLEIMGGY